MVSKMWGWSTGGSEGEASKMGEKKDKKKIQRRASGKGRKRNRPARKRRRPWEAEERRGYKEEKEKMLVMTGRRKRDRWLFRGEG